MRAWWPGLETARDPDPQGSQSRLIRLLFVSYGLFLSGLFSFPEAHQRYWFYVGGVLPPFLPFVLLTLRWICLRRGPRLALAFIAYMAVSATWSDGAGRQCIAAAAGQGLLTASFLSVSMLLVHQSGDGLWTLLKLVSVGAAVFGLASIVIWYADHPFPQSRLVSFSKLNNPVLVGLAYGPLVLLNAAHLLAAQSVPRRMFSLLVFSVLCTVVLLTQSRNAVVAVVIGLGILFCCRRWSSAALALALALILLSVMFGARLLERFTEGVGYRAAIWRTTVERISTAPLTGHGYCSDTTVTVAGHVFVHAHSGYLSAARDGGIIGLGLLILLLIQAISNAIAKWRQGGEPVFAALMVYSIVCMLADTDRLLGPPNEAWLYFWLPIALASAPRVLPRAERLKLP